MSLDGKSQTKFKIKTICLESNQTCMNQTLHAKKRHSLIQIICSLLLHLLPCKGRTAQLREICESLNLPLSKM